MLTAAYLATQNMSTSMHIQILSAVLYLILPAAAQCLEKYYEKVKLNNLLAASANRKRFAY
jgi:hypothetical protein